jgi:diacylglycerol kinase (ATP)
MNNNPMTNHREGYRATGGEVAHKKKLLFIVNPRSGTQSKKGIVAQITQEISRTQFDYDIIYTQDKGHAVELASQAAGEGVDYVVAVGGDGTMNEVARSLVGTSSALGIIPMGSGNGLARHLNVPMDTLAAIRLISRARTIAMDSCSLNGQPFFCVAGVGFDAHVGLCFSQQKTRGFGTYVRTTLREFMKYQPDTYRLQINGQTLEKCAFLVSFANASQYGNNAYIAPRASVQDGLLDVCVVEPFPRAQTPVLGIKLFNRTIQQSPYVQTYRTDELWVETAADVPLHLDGEPRRSGNQIHVKVHSGSIRVLVPDTGKIPPKG